MDKSDNKRMEILIPQIEHLTTSSQISSKKYLKGALPDTNIQYFSVKSGLSKGETSNKEIRTTITTENVMQIILKTE